MPKKKYSLFNCVAHTKEKMEVSVLIKKGSPIKEIPMLTDEILGSISNLQASDEEKKLLEKIFIAGSTLKNLKEPNKEKEHLLSFIAGITNFFVSEEGTKDTILLKELIAQFKKESEKIDLGQYETLPENLLVNEFRESSPSSLTSEIQSVRLKKTLQKNEEENSPNGFSIKKEDLSRNRLKRIDSSNLATTASKEEVSELEKKLAKQREKSEGSNTINTDSLTSGENSSKLDENSKQITPILNGVVSSVISNEESDSNSEGGSEDFDFLENVCNAAGFSDAESDTSTHSRNPLSTIYEDSTRQSATTKGGLEKLEDILNEIGEFIKEQDNEVKKPAVSKNIENSESNSKLEVTTKNQSKLLKRILESSTFKRMKNTDQENNSPVVIAAIPKMKS